jgi:hypothetical protein
VAEDLSFMNEKFFSLLRLESAFPRPIGDSANPQTHAFTVRVSIIADADVDRVVYDGARGLAASFVQIAKDQIGQGAFAVGTSCGFLFEHQAEIQKQLKVPFISSSLTMLSTGLAEPIAVLSFDGELLSQAVWFKKACIGIEKILVRGIPKSGHLFRVIRENQTALNLKVAETEVVQSALDLTQICIETYGEPPRTVLLECTNLGVYRTAIQKALDDCRYQCELIDYNDVMARCWTALQKK